MKLVILDRDGVINHDSKEFIKSPEEWQPIKGSLEAIARLSQAGYEVIILSNQSGIGRGLFSADALGQIHVKMMDYINKHGGRIHSISFCPHHPDDDCDCRKPKTGLYDELAKRMNVSFKDVYSVGDSLRDLQAAQAAGATPVLVKTGNGKKTLNKLKSDPQAEFQELQVFDDLAKFVDKLQNKKLSAKSRKHSTKKNAR